jgi:hypothetical protein
MIAAEEILNGEEEGWLDGEDLKMEMVVGGMVASSRSYRALSR